MLTADFLFCFGKLAFGNRMALTMILLMESASSHASTDESFQIVNCNVPLPRNTAFETISRPIPQTMGIDDNSRCEAVIRGLPKNVVSAIDFLLTDIASSRSQKPLRVEEDMNLNVTRSEEDMNFITPLTFGMISLIESGSQRTIRRSTSPEITSKSILNPVICSPSSSRANSIESLSDVKEQQEETKEDSLSEITST